MRFLKQIIAALVFAGVAPNVLSQLAFAPPVVYSVGFDPEHVATGDFNGDGKPDIASANYYGNSLSVLTNDGHGNFKLASTVPSYRSTCLAVADFNNDNKLDLAAGNDGLDTVSVFTNVGNALFVLASTNSVSARPKALFAADINTDGKQDIVVGNYNNSGTGNYLSVLTNGGGGRFATASSPSIQGAGYSVAVADINGDGYLDLINAGGYLTILTNRASGQFSAFPGPYLAGPQRVVAADVNADGYMDLITANSSQNPLLVVTNGGAGDFVISSLPSVIGGPSFPVIATDVNGDAQLDLVVGNNAGVIYDNSISILTNGGRGGFSLACTLAAIAPKWIASADFNGDGKVDLVAANSALHKIAVYFAVPTLKAQFSNNSLIVSWPSSWTNWVLQQTTGVSLPNWTASSGVADDGINQSLSVSAPAGNSFFRLAAP